MHERTWYNDRRSDEFDIVITFQLVSILLAQFEKFDVFFGLDCFLVGSVIQQAIVHDSAAAVNDPFLVQCARLEQDWIVFRGR